MATTNNTDQSVSHQMMNVKVSIVVPAYNCEQYLSDTLDSILSQSYSNWECIIVNDGSMDTTKDIAQSYCIKDSRFHYYFQENQGPASARNLAIRNSSGEYILPLDADDIISDSYIEKAANYLSEHPETTLVYSKGDFFGEESGEWDLPEYNYDSFIWHNSICSCAMYRRKDYDRTKGYNINMVYGDEDWDFWLSLLNKESIVYRIDEVLFHYRIQKHSRTTDYLTPNIKKAKRLIYHNHESLYQPFIEDIVFINDVNANLAQQLFETQKQLENNRRSLAYRIGKIILKPLSLLRSSLRCR